MFNKINCDLKKSSGFLMINPNFVIDITTCMTTISGLGRLTLKVNEDD